MSAATQTKIFGIRLGIDPKIIVVALLAVAGLLFWFNSRGGEEGNGVAPARPQTPANLTEEPRAERMGVRRELGTSNRAALSMRKIDPTRGDIDPTLRLDLLARLQKVELSATGRNIFEMGPAPEAVAAMARAIRGPVVPPRPIAPVPRPVMVSTGAMVNIPLKYYGFVKPADKTSPNRGFFLDGDNVLVASEGDVLKKRYLVVELTPNLAKMEDVQLKQGQTLAVVPEAVVPQ